MKLSRFCRLVSIVAVTMFFSQSLNAQTTAIQVPITNGDFILGRLSIGNPTGTLRLTLSSTVDEYGCTKYELRYCATNIMLDVREPNTMIGLSLLSGNDIVVAVCDENQCVVDFPMTGTMKVQVIRPQLMTPITYTLHCWINLRWNRCTNEWTMVTFFAIG